MKRKSPTSTEAAKPGRLEASTHPRFYASTLPLLIASALMLTVIQPPVGWSFLAWVAVVPFAVACSPQVRGRRLAFAAFVVGYLYWLGNLYWIEPITILGWLGMGLYLSLFWVLPALSLRFVRGKRIPLFIALPVLLAGWERLQGFPMGGFFWRFLGHSQYEHLAVIQVADLVGAAGVSFVVAMVNGVFADLILYVVSRRRVGLAPPEPHRPQESVGQAPPYEPVRSPVGSTVAIGLVATSAIVAGALLYGQWRLRQTPEYVADGPLVGSLQSNVPQSVKETFEASTELFDGLMADSKAAAAAGAKLILWPETMVQGILDPGLWPYLRGNSEDFLDEDKAFHKALSDHAREDAVSLLVGAYGMEIHQDSRGDSYLASFNSAYFYHADGTRDPGRYDKIHLVLFGEYIPFQHRFPWLFEQLKRLFPDGYNPTYSLEKGTHYTVFEMSRGTEDGGQRAVDGSQKITEDVSSPPYHFGVIICYEDSIPYVGRNFALDKQGRKRVDWLVNISNDGWFVRFPESDGRVIPSSELAQHAAICTFRAVENRLAVVRSVNTGISCLIDSTGRIRNGYIAASKDFPAEAMNRTAMAGWFVDRLPIDKRVAFYSRHGEWFADGCATVFVGALLWPLTIWWRRRRKQTAS